MHTIHKTEVLTILRSVVARLEAMGSGDAWSRDHFGEIANQFNGLYFRLQFWRGTEDPADLMIQARDKRIAELEAQCANYIVQATAAQCEATHLRTQLDHFKAEVHRLNLLLSPHPQREERCTICGKMTSDWVDPDWAHGRICRTCDVNPCIGNDCETD